MKRMLSFLLALALPLSGAAQSPRQAYIDRYAALAVSEMQRTGVPASITLAQALLESGAGQSPLAVKAHNHFGLKCHNDWDGERFLYDDETPDECFRVYASAEDSYRAHSDYLLGHERYRALFDLNPTDYKAWAKGLRRAGYATDPDYAGKLINLIEDFRLDRFDTLTDASAVPVEQEITFRPSLPVIQEEETPGEAVEEEAVAEERAVATAPKPEEKEPGTARQGYKEHVSLSFARETYKQNGVPYVRTIEGETWESLADAYGFFVRQLLYYNDLSAPTELEPGTRVYLARKKAQAEPGYGKYLVEQEGETLWDVSQKFGIRLKKLRLYNIWRANSPLKPGDTVVLRKL